MEGSIVRINNMKFRVIREYHSDTYEKDYILLKELKSKELYVCEVDAKGYIQEVTDAGEMGMLEIVFAEQLDPE